MEQTKRGRACEHEMYRFRTILECFPNTLQESLSPLRNGIPGICDVSVKSLCSSKHLAVQNSCSTFALLLEETAKLVEEAFEKHYPCLLLFAENASAACNDNETMRLVGSYLSALTSLSMFVGRVSQVFRNMLQQVREFSQLSSNILPAAYERTLLRVWKGLGDLLSIFIKIDEISRKESIIRSAWSVFVRSIETVNLNPSLFSADSLDFNKLLSSLTVIEGQLMVGNCLRNCYEQSFGALDNDTTFSNRIKDIILEMYSKWEKSAETDIPDKRGLMSIVGLTVFYHLHYLQPEKKVVKTVFNCHKKVVCFYLFGCTTWNPCDFMMREICDLKNIVSNKTLTTVQLASSSYDCDQVLQQAATKITAVDDWLRTLRNKLSRKTVGDAAHSLEIAELCLKGARLSDVMCRSLKVFLSASNDVITRGNTYTVFNIIQTVKLISATISDNWTVISENCQLALQQWRCHSLNMLEQIQNKLRDGGDEARSSACKIAIDCLLSSVSSTRLQVYGVALELCQYQNLLKSADLAELEGLLSRMSTLCRLDNLIERISDCSFLFFHRTLITIYWETVFDRMPDFVSIRLFSDALSDSLRYAESHGLPQLHSWRQFLYEIIEKEFLSPLCAFVENDLRVLTHTHLIVSERDKTPKDMFNFLRKVMCVEKNFVIHDMDIDICEFVTKYLEKVFYNLTAVALHDCHAYSRMASLAESRYDLNVVSSDLPHQSVDQSLDVIHAVRSLPIFVSKYNYCLNQQMFVEKRSANRTLRVVSSDHMTASLRTHGLGILSTTVNLVYQLLRKNVSVLSQFLADEQIRAQLQRDRRHFENNKKETPESQIFSAKRAQRFYATISSLGTNEEDVSYMDKTRQNITVMGNCIGFVRAMVNSAASIESELQNLQNADMMASSCLDEDGLLFKRFFDEIFDSISDDKNYLKILVDVFQTGFSDNDKFDHLSNFFVLVPSLTISHMEHMLKSRERLKKRGHGTQEMTFVDDGFSLGVAFLLSVFNQWSNYNSLNWIRSWKNKLEEDGHSVSKDLLETKDRRADKLRVARVNDAHTEFQQLMFSFQSARVFFSFDETDG